MTGAWLRVDVAELIQALESPRECDAVIKAAALRKSVLAGETSAPLPQAPQPGQPCGAIDPALGFTCDLPASHDGRHAERTWDSQPIASWASVPRFCAVQNPDGGLCTRDEGHGGDHASRGMHTRWANEPPAWHLAPPNPYALDSLATYHASTQTGDQS